MIYGIPTAIFFVFWGTYIYFRADRTAREFREKIESGQEDYFEEQRTYRAYPWVQQSKYQRRIGVIVFLCGAILCTIQIFAP